MAGRPSRPRRVTVVHVSGACWLCRTQLLDHVQLTPVGVRPHREEHLEAITHESSIELEWLGSQRVAADGAGGSLPPSSRPRPWRRLPTALAARRPPARLPQVLAAPRLAWKPSHGAPVSHSVVPLGTNPNASVRTHADSAPVAICSPAARCCQLTALAGRPPGDGNAAAGLGAENERLKAELATALQAAAQWKALHGKLRDYAVAELIESGS